MATILFLDAIPYASGQAFEPETVEAMAIGGGCGRIVAVSSAYSISSSARAMSFTNGCM